MNTQKMISIIIPMYNAANTIEKCLDSILFSSNNQIEIITIDDCSFDSTALIIEQKYKDKVIFLKNEHNEGPSYSRNKGLKIATGKYVCFVDADDCVSNEYVNTLIEKVHLNYDIVFFDYKNRKKMNFPLERDKQLLFLFKYVLFGFTWNKMIKKEILDNNKIFYNVNQNYCEDQLFLFETMKFCNSIVYCPKKIYVYNDTPNSLSKKNHSKELLEMVYLQKKSFFQTEKLLNSKEGVNIFSRYCMEMFLRSKMEKDTIIFEDYIKYKKNLKIKDKMLVIYNRFKYFYNKLIK